MIINEAWVAYVEGRLFRHESIDEVISYRRSTQWLVAKLTRMGVPFKIYNMGAGVTRVTTETDKCPCCKKPVAKEDSE